MPTVVTANNDGTDPAVTTLPSLGGRPGYLSPTVPTPAPIDAAPAASLVDDHALNAESPAHSVSATESTTPTESSPPVQDETQDADDTRGVQKRIDTLTRIRREQEREIARLNAQIAANVAHREQNAGQPAPATTNVPQNGRPSRDQYADADQYIEALAEWKAVQTADRIVAQRDAAREQANRQLTWQEQQAHFAQTHPDYFDRVAEADASGVSFAPHVGEAIMDSGMGPSLVYHLALHPETVQRWNTLRPTQVGMELGLLRQTLLPSDVAPTPTPARPTPPRDETTGRFVPQTPQSQRQPTPSMPVNPAPLGNGVVSSATPADIAARSGSLREYNQSRGSYSPRRRW